MKIAVCLSGNLRTYKETYIAWKTYFYEKYDCDVFLHTWDFAGPNTRHIDNMRSPADYTLPIGYNIQELYDVYNFTDVTIDKYYPKFYNKFYDDAQRIMFNRIYCSDGKYDPVNDVRIFNRELDFINYHSMWYKRWKCFDMMQMHALHNNIQYDLIIVSRPDLNLCGSLTNVPLDKLTVPYEERKDDPNKLDIKNVEEIFDGWAIGPLHLVREYCLFYERLDYYIRKWKLGTFPLTHSNILYRYLYDLNLPILLTYHTQHLLDGNNPITDLTWGLVR